MALTPPFRTLLPTALTAAFAIGLLISLPASAAQPGGQPLRAAPAAHPTVRPPRPQQEHLAQWMDRHRNLPLEQQQRELEREPGFRDLPPQTQQRMRERLTQLNNMAPQQRTRLLERTEAMEKLTPQQRQQFRSAVQQLGTLPIERRRLVSRAFLDIRDMPVSQRQAVLASDRFRAQLSDQERATLSSLLAVEPYLPPQAPNEAP